MSLDSAIKQRLGAVTGVRAQIGTRAWAVTAPGNAELPYVTWQVISETPNHAMSVEAAYREARLQVNAFGKDHAEARAVGEAVRTALNRFRGTSGGTVVQDILADTGSGSFLAEVEDGVYHQPRDYRVFYE